MASDRFRGSQLGRGWNPADHPRDPLGRFSLVGGGGSKKLDAPPLGRRPKRFVPVGNTGVARSSDLHPPALGTDYGDDPSLHSIDSWGDVDDLEVLPEGAVSQVVTRDFRALGIDNSIGADYTRMSQPSVEIARPGWGEDSWRGTPGAQAETDLRSLYAPGSPVAQDPARTRDLGSLGAMNQGVRRGPLHDPNTGRTLDTGAVIKGTSTAAESDAELLASEVGHAIGAPSPYVLQNPTNNREVAMEEVFGPMGYNTDAPTAADGREVVRNYREGAARLNVLDQLTGNRDRHDGNWILTDDGTPVGIDNGLAFGGGNEPYRSVEQIRRVQTEYLKGMSQKSGDWNQFNDRIGLEEMRDWRPRLMELRPAFDARGHSDWHDQLMEHYGQLLREKHDEWA